jgi:hypothetical protein
VVCNRFERFSAFPRYATCSSSRTTLGTHPSFQHRDKFATTNVMSDSGLSAPGSSVYSSDSMYVGDGTWDSERNTFLLPNLQGLNFETMRYNGKMACSNVEYPR